MTQTTDSCVTKRLEINENTDKTEQLKRALDLHAEWLRGSLGGKKLDLRCVNLRCADLSGVDLRWADLSEASLGEASLFRADLREADLSGADLSGTSFTESNLTGANLSGVNLNEAGLRGSILIGADLSGANLSKADLRMADLSEASYAVTQVLLARWGALSDELTLECMRHDAACLPDPSAMDRWAKSLESECPCPGIGGTGRIIDFSEKRRVWRSGKPKMSLRQVWEAIAAEKGVTI